MKVLDLESPKVLKLDTYNGSVEVLGFRSLINKYKILIGPRLQNLKNIRFVYLRHVMAKEAPRFKHVMA